MNKINKVFNNDSVNIVFAANNVYAPYLAVALQSMSEHFNPERCYDIIILQPDFTDENKNVIKQVVGSGDNISVRFIDAKKIYEKLDKEKLFTHLHFTAEMYLRLFIPDLMSDYDKTIYLDCDMIFNSDIAELYDIDLGENYLGAVKDYNLLVAYISYPKLQHYFDNIICIKDINRYFNSGTLLMNLKKFREIDLLEKSFEILDHYKELLYPDQDILNILCQDNLVILESSWNFVFCINTRLVLDNHLIEPALEWVKGLEKRHVIHYLTQFKPWNTPNMYYADVWWEHAKKTPIYQSLLKEYFDSHPDELVKARKEQGFNS